MKVKLRETLQKPPAKLAAKTMLTMMVRGGAGALAVITFALLANQLGEASFGHFAAGTSVAAVGTQIATRGSPTTALRFMAKAAAPEDQGRLNAMVRWSTRRAFIGAVTVVGLLVAAPFFALLGSIDTFTAARAAAPLMFVMVFAELTSHQLRAMEKLASSLFAKELFWRSTLLVAAVLFIQFDISPSADRILLLSAGLLAAGTVFQAIQLRRALPTPSAWQAPTKEWAASARANWGWVALRTSVPHGSVVAVGAAIDPIAAAVLFSALRVAGLLAVPLTALDFVIAPQLSNDADRSHGTALQSTLRRSMVLLAPTTLALASALLVGGQWILEQFGDEIGGQAWTLRILVAGAVVNALCGPTVPLMQMTGNERFLLKSRTLSTIVGASLVLLSARFGVTLAATGIAISQAGWNVACVARSRSALGADPSIFSLVRRSA